MNEERTESLLRHKEHIRGYLWHTYSVTDNQVMVSTGRYILHTQVLPEYATNEMHSTFQL